MTFSLIKKLENELQQFKNDLNGYKAELDKLVVAVENINADYHYSLARVQEKSNDVKGSIAFCQTSIDEYENALRVLEQAQDNEHVNG